MEEMFKPIPGYENYYEISNFGRIRNFVGGKGRTAGRIIKSFPTGHGYYEATLYINGQRGRIRTHAMVMLLFMGIRPEGLQINHKDGNKSNNCLDNLEYVTPKQNVQHAINIGLVKKEKRYIGEPPDIKIKCLRCVIIKSVDLFRKSKRDSYQSYCRDCMNRLNREYKKKLRDNKER